jgi:protein gp37
VPWYYIRQVFDVMEATPQHTYQILTKRPKRLEWFELLWIRKWWTPNIWLGVSVESAKYLSRIDALRSAGAQTKFLSLEPLLGPLPNLDLDGIDWVIVGGESGPHARPMRPEWVTDIRDQCISAKVPFFFKQWGGVNKKTAGCLLEGREWKEWPQR